MNQENERLNSAVPEGLLPVKRKRGRPRKEDNQFQGGNSVISPGSNGAKRIRRRKIDPAYSPNADNALVGQIVNGVLDGSFDAGYLLTVRVGNTGTVLRGVVFEPGLSVPISSENDVAPQVKMFQRNEAPHHVNDLPNPVPSSSPQVLQSDPKGQQPVKLQPRNETAKASSEINTHLLAENLQKKDTNVSAEGPVSTLLALQAKTNTEQNPEISSRNENTHLQKRLSEDVNKVPLHASESAHSKLEAEKLTELLQSKKSMTTLVADVTKGTQVASQSSNSELGVEKTVEILWENKITPVTKESPDEVRKEPLVEPHALPFVLNTERPKKILQENNASLPVNDINQTPPSEDLQPEMKKDEPEEILQRESISVKENMVISQNPLEEPQVSKSTVTEKEYSPGKPVPN